MLTWRQSRPATTTSRLSVSDSASPRRTAAMQSATRSPTVGEVERAVARAEHAEVLHPGVAVAAEQARRHLLDHAQAEVLERRHRLAELDLAAGLVERDARAARARSAARRRTAAPRARAGRSTRCRRPSSPGRPRRGSTRGSAAPSAPPARARAPGPKRSTSRSRSAVVPRARERDQLLLELAQRHVGHAAGDVHGGVHAHPLALAEHRVRVDRVGAEALAQQRRERVQQLGVVARRRAAPRSARPSARRTRRGRAAARGRPRARAARRPRGAGRRCGPRTARPSGTSRTARPRPCSRASPRSGPRGAGSGAACGSAAASARRARRRPCVVNRPSMRASPVMRPSAETLRTPT